MSTKIFSCVVDETPRLKLQTLGWLYTLIGTHCATREEIVVHVAHGVSPTFRRTIEEFGVRTREIPRFGEGTAAFCNKISQLHSLAEYSRDYYVLCDVDLAFTADIAPWFTGNAVRASVVGLSNPPLEVLQSLYASTGLAVMPELVPTVFGDGLTFGANCNGGLYMVPKKWLESLTEGWPRWANFAIKHAGTLGRYALHADQLGFCFAALESSLPIEHLPLSINFHTHLPLKEYGSSLRTVDPIVLHYHGHVDDIGLLRPMGLPLVDARIAQANDLIRDARRSQFGDFSSLLRALE